MKKVTVIGIGRVGLPLALYLDSLGFQVVGIDRDASLIQQLRERRMPFSESGCDKLLERSTALFTADIQKAKDTSFIFITVGTPLRPHIETDLSHVDDVVRGLVPFLQRGQCVILRSTVAPATTEYVSALIERAGPLRIGTDIGLAYCPERLSEHHALEELRKLPQIIGCEDDLSYGMAVEVFETFNVKLLRSNYLAAELAKLFNNAARYLEFAIANQFALYASAFNQDVYEILTLCNQDYPRSFKYTPGLTAGTCLRKDFGMLNETSPGPDLFLTAWKVNESMPLHLVRCAERFRPIKGANVAVLGYTFKRNSDDARDSLVPKLIRYLERRMPESIVVCEPNITETSIDRYRNVDLQFALRDADVVFLAMDHECFSNRELVLGPLKPGAVLIDLWNCLNENTLVIVK